MEEVRREADQALAHVQEALGYPQHEEVVGLPCVVGSQTAQHATHPDTHAPQRERPAYPHNRERACVSLCACLSVSVRARV